MAQRDRRGGVLRPSRRPGQGRAAPDMGLSPGAGDWPGVVRDAVTTGDGVPERARRAVCLREARQRRGSRIQRRHRTRQRHLLWREVDPGAPGHGPDCPRDCPPVVRQCGHRERLGRRLAQRGIRHVLHPARGGTPRRARCLRRRTEAQSRGRLHARAREPGRGRAARQPVGHEEGAQPDHLPEGRLDAAHAAPPDGHRGVLGRHPRLLQALPRWQRHHGGLPAGHGGACRPGPRVVLHAMARAAGLTRRRGRLALRRHRTAPRDRPRADAAR